MDPHFHGDTIVRFLDDAEEAGEDAFVCIWRGGGKTGLITEPRPAWWLAKNPFVRVGLANATGDGASLMVRVSASIIKSSWAYRQAFPETIPGDKWGEDGYYLKVSDEEEESFGTKERKQPSLKGYGVRGNITGSHFNGGFIVDDLLNEEMADSEQMRRRVERFWGELTNTIDPGCPLIGCGTRWTFDDYLGKIISGELTGPKGRIKVLQCNVSNYNPQTKQHELTSPRRTWYDDHGNAYEYGEDFDSLEAKKKALKSRFSALYYNSPVLAEDIQFDVQNIQFFQKLPPPFELGPVGRMLIETESGSKAIMSTYSQMNKALHRNISVEEVSVRRVDKDTRIRTILQPIIANFQLVMRQDIYDREDNLGQELRTFPKSTYKDCLDALCHAIEAAQHDKDDLYPRVHIAVDPAFTDEDYSDFTAICAVCRFQGQYWILDCQRFQTSRADYIVNMHYAVYDRFNNMAFKEEAQQATKKKGFSSMRTKRHNGGRRRSDLYRDSFDIDLTVVQRDNRK